MELYKNEKWLREKYWKEGLSVARIAAQVGRSGATIWQWMKKFDIPRRVKRPMKSKEWLQEKYLEEHLNGLEIAILAGCCSSTVYNWLAYYDIPRRHVNQSTESRFWDKVKKGNGCWEWQAGLSTNGYGKFGLNGKTVIAHRVAWQLTHGEIPNGLCVLHRCDNPKCCNPNHLFLGTQADNAIDKVAKGRQSKGEQHGNSKLTEDNVKDIRRLYAEGNLLQREIGEIYNVTQGCVGLITRFRLWNWLTC